jgi:hypothetical protein
MKTEVRTDITDWVDEWVHDETDMAQDDIIVKLTTQGYPAGKIARMAVSARLNGKAPDDILDSNKLLLYAGARRDVARRIETRKRGHVREFIGKHSEPVDEEGGEEDRPSGYVRSLSDDGLRLAESYLLNHVPGHIRNHLRIVAANGGDATAVADKLCSKITELAEVTMREAAMIQA